MMQKLEAVISCPAIQPEACPPQHLDKALMAMMAALPRQGKDAVSSAVMLRQYVLKLSKHPKEAIDHLWSASIDRLKWFPTVAECNEIIAEWTSRAAEQRHAKDIAGSRIKREKQARFEDAMRSLRKGELSQAEIDALPDKWKRHAVTAGHLWLLKDGAYRARPDFLWMSDEQVEEHRQLVAGWQAEGLL
ncbi:hypothetical protein [Novosphingobium sp.]|uniref:hypothetical protein n=1 Tax=Novosphingobium sp. TaxID=1874826 RepID=UPI002FDD7AA1